MHSRPLEKTLLCIVRIVSDANFQIVADTSFPSIPPTKLVFVICVLSSITSDRVDDVYKAKLVLPVAEASFF